MGNQTTQPVSDPGTKASQLTAYDYLVMLIFSQLIRRQDYSLAVQGALDAATCYFKTLQKSAVK